MLISLDAGGSLGATFVALFLGCFYFLPTIVALVRKLRSIGPTIVVNLFLGWTFIGWVVALAMAFGQTRDDPWAGRAAPATSSTLYSPDGRYWWDGTGWRALPTTDPAGGTPTPCQWGSTSEEA
jgi:hypothetical protein